MKVHNEYQQNSLEWLMARCGIPTASEFDNLLTPEFKIRSGEMPKAYLAKKVAEAWTGTPLPGWNTIDMDLGKILEEQAKPAYTLETGEEIESVGFITTDDGRVGCSPDGLLGETSGIEIKCPEAHTHVRYLLAGVLPKDYAAQVHGSMFVTGRASWKFMSYHRGFPPLIVTVWRNVDIQQSINDALMDFLVEMVKARAKLEQLNGGPPRRPAAPTAPVETPEYQDIIP